MTTFLPTLITASRASLVAALQTIAQARAADALTAHMTPRCISRDRACRRRTGLAALIPREHVRAPDLAEFEQWQDACGGLIGLVTLSPHWPEAPAYIAALSRRGVTVSLGHTAAEPHTIRAAVDAGRHLVHPSRQRRRRHPAPASEPHLDAAFRGQADRNLHRRRASPARRHLESDAARQGPERAVLVSDATALAGCRPGSTTSQSAGGWNSRRMVVSELSARLTWQVRRGP